MSTEALDLPLKDLDRGLPYSSDFKTFVML